MHRQKNLCNHPPPPHTHTHPLTRHKPSLFSVHPINNINKWFFSRLPEIQKHPAYRLLSRSKQWPSSGCAQAITHNHLNLHTPTHPTPSPSSQRVSQASALHEVHNWSVRTQPLPDQQRDNRTAAAGMSSTQPQVSVLACRDMTFPFKSRTEYRQMSFFQRTIPDWNGLLQLWEGHHLDCPGSPPPHPPPEKLTPPFPSPTHPPTSLLPISISPSPLPIYPIPSPSLVDNCHWIISHTSLQMYSALSWSCTANHLMA